MTKKRFFKLSALIIAGTMLLSAPFQALAVESTTGPETEEQTQSTETTFDGQAEELTVPTSDMPDKTSQEVWQEDEKSVASDEQYETLEEDGSEPFETSEDEPNMTVEETEPETTGNCGEELIWEYEDGKLYITGRGSMYEYVRGEQPGWYVYEGVIRELYLDREMTALSLDAFVGMTALEYVYYGGNRLEWDSMLFTGSSDFFGDEITEDEVFPSAEILFEGETEEEINPEETESVGEPVEEDQDTAEEQIEVSSGEEVPVSEETEVEKRTVERLSGTEIQNASAIVITTQPTDVEAAEEETVSLTVSATGTDLTYQWQWSTNRSSWKNCTSAGCNTDTFSFRMKPVVDGRYYRCIITSGTSSISSREALVKLASGGLAITSQPTAVNALEGETVSFHVEANKDEVSYQWQWSADNKSWKNCTSAGYNADTFSFAMKAAIDGRYYRCMVTSGSEKVFSDGALVTLSDEGLKIISQPVAATALEGETVTFQVEASKSEVSYQWQWSADNRTWKNCTSAGYNTDTFSFAMKAAIDGRYYRCMVTSGSEKVFSDGALVTLSEEGLQILSQPIAVDAQEGEIVSFHVEANKSGVSYQWQWSADNRSWKNCTSAGFNSDTFSFAMKSAIDGRYYRCMVSIGSEKVYSEGAPIRLSVGGLEILVQPQDVKAPEGETVRLHVEANQENASYQWQWSATGSSWKNCTSAGANTDTFSFTMKAAINGRYYRCIVMSGNNRVESESALISLENREIEINGVVYAEVEGKMTVTEYRGNAESVTVEETVNGQTVIVIGESAFEGNTTITHIDLPDTIQVIKKRAFAGCSNLAKMD